ncbi:hypothetical protein HHI36_021319 [Cryptolaemus montrouzieri]|uniref:Peptidase S1 domain-containing protein n=1 Tax=Cryptolaemus montrouzieri TaxID=559131 RepID=A0ABD2MWP8_9CUCU
MFTLFCILFIINAYTEAEHFSFHDRLSHTDPDGTLEIIGGKTAFPHWLGYQAGIKIEQNEGSVLFCGGSLITPSYILTAAHCLNSVYSLEVILGAHNISKKERTQLIIEPKNYTIHPDWNPELLINDIALIKLPKPVKIGLSKRTVRLPKDDKKNYAGQKGIVSGWGITKYNQTISNVLEYAKSIILSNEECKKIHPFDRVIQDTHLCLSGAGRISSCQGDSGGPLVVKGVQVGIVSFSMKKCNTTTPSVFTRVSKYLKWIREISDL